MMNCSCGGGFHTMQDVEKALHNLRKADPAGVLADQKKFYDDMHRRFVVMKDTINKEVLQQDGLGLTNAVLLSSGSMNGVTDSDRLHAFESWIAGLIASTILFNGESEVSKWTDAYIIQAWDKGAHHTVSQLEDPELDQELSDLPETLSIATAAGAVAAVLLTNAWSEMEGIAAGLKQRATRAVTDGLLKKQNPKQITEALQSVINETENRRTSVLVHMETMRAAIRGATQTLRLNRISSVTLVAEWLTMQDGHVCPRCRANEGKVFSLEEIEALIPLHGLCRCWFRIV